MSKSAAIKPAKQATTRNTKTAASTRGLFAIFVDSLPEDFDVLKHLYNMEYTVVFTETLAAAKTFLNKNYNDPSGILVVDLRTLQCFKVTVTQHVGFTPHVAEHKKPEPDVG